MTNWPNIQEYRNFEAKFFEDSMRLIDSAANSNTKTVIKDECNNNKNDVNDLINNEKVKNSDPKTVRCIITKDFEENFKKFDRENGIVHHDLGVSKPQEVEAMEHSLVDKIRLQNHLKWMKQKEEEYHKKKENERLALERKKEEELRLERIRKQKEKEREEKIKEWQEQKAREKEEKKKEQMVMKMLQEGLKVTPSVDKEKLIEEWVKLKNKQKQMEAEKKAKLQKKEEENRLLRQNLAELSYRQWKERIKGRMMTLPKNGYQIFGPKPVPVVKEDWNHDFTRNSPRNLKNTMRESKTNLCSSLSFRPGLKELEDLSKNIFYLGALKSRSPSLCHLSRTRSGLNFLENSERTQKAQCDMPLKELQQGTIDLKKKMPKKDCFEQKKDFAFLKPNPKSEMNFSKVKERHPKIIAKESFQAQGDQNQCISSLCNKSPAEPANNSPFFELLPSKKKLDLYINTCQDVSEDNIKNKKSKNTETQKIKKKEVTEKKTINESKKNSFKEKCCAPGRTRSLSLQNSVKKTEKNVKVPVKKATEPVNPKLNNTCRRSRSYDKSIKKVTKSEPKMKSCLLSKSMLKVSETIETSKNVKSEKSKISCNQKRRSRSTKPVSPKILTQAVLKKPSEGDIKTKKKCKKKTSLSKSFSFNDSPYCAKNSTKSLTKTKVGRRKNVKDAETKSEESRNCRGTEGK